jgi:hypothetical protein
METQHAAINPLREARLEGKVIIVDDSFPSPPSQGIILAADDPGSNQSHDYEPTNSLPSISTIKRKMDNSGNHFIVTVFLFFHLFLLCLSESSYFFNYFIKTYW